MPRRCRLCGDARLSRSPPRTPVAATTQATAPDQSGAIQPRPSNTLLPDFSNLVTQVGPAVVSVTNHLKQSPDQGQGMPFGGLPFPFGQMPGNQMPGNHQTHAVEARGSGFIIDPAASSSPTITWSRNEQRPHGHA